MIKMNENKIKLISFSTKEKKALVEHCNIVDKHLLETISNSKTGQIPIFEDEYELFLIALNHEAITTDEPEIQKIFSILHQRLSQQFSSVPVDHPTPLQSGSIEELLAGKDFSSVEELNKKLHSFHTQKNSTPDPEMGNLSPNQVSMLIYTKWEDSKCPIKFNENLPFELVKHSTLFTNARLLLKKLLELKNKNTATDKGNLNRLVVKQLFDEMMLDERYRESTIRYNKVLNEVDVFPLHIVRVVCDCAGLIKKRSKRFIVPKKYQGLISDDKAGMLYYMLFNAYFTKFNMGYVGRFPAIDSIQTTVSYSFYRISKLCNKYCKLKYLLHNIFLPKVCEDIRECKFAPPEGEWLVESRIIAPLEKFGLLECELKKEKYYSRTSEAIKTELFDKFMKFEL